MSSSVCQGLQSCLEVVESRVSRLKLAPTKSNFPPSIVTTDPKPTVYNEEKNTTITNTNDMGGWSCIQSLSNAKASTENDKVYVHPLVKRSASRLSEKSLEMCTERLGSETGSEVSDCSDDISLFSMDTRSQTVACNIPPKPRAIRKMSRSSSFPPPLTSISGSNCVQVKSHREGGRLVLQAVSFPPCRTYFHAERSYGRLRLSLYKDASPVFQDQDGQEEDQEEEEEEEEEEETVVEEEEFYGETEIKEANSGNVGGEIGTGKLPIPSSCKENGCGHKGLLHWKPFLVAT
ncbi:protein FANTASTIC FOUR 1 [Gossypium raimondii]|uniref:protein FANTASTIC FOUR 1 n=1 Tax=Gossypium raimondii TaxID=29730 RepID=UPI00227AA22F|nr:protein FANTASTIC FOUR 1 [Gossypium raimondii]